MATRKLFGRTMFMDGMSGFVFNGEVALMSDFKGRTEFHIVDSETGERERLVWTHGSNWIPGMQLIQVIMERHHAAEINLVEESEPEYIQCPACGGAKQVENDEGNWKPCPECMGVP